MKGSIEDMEESVLLCFFHLKQQRYNYSAPKYSAGAILLPVSCLFTLFCTPRAPPPPLYSRQLLLEAYRHAWEKLEALHKIWGEGG